MKLFKIRQNETGRSMIEMLAVLTIIGILSSVSVYSYRYASDKFRANELINDIQLRLSDLTIQIEQGLKLSLAAWSRVGKSGFVISDIQTFNEQDYFTVQTLPQAVCHLIIDAFKQSYEIEINNKLLSEGGRCDVENVLKFYLYLIPCRPICSEGEICETGICMGTNNKILTSGWLPCVTDNDCHKNCWFCNQEKHRCQSAENNTSCFIGKEEGFCYYRGCVPKVEICQIHEDCAVDEYCADKNDSCFVSSPYKCKKLNATKKNITLDNGQKEIWYFSQTTLMYWDALRFCEKLGKDMLRIEEVIDDWDGKKGTGYTGTNRLQKFKEINISAGAGGLWCYDADYMCEAWIVSTDGSVTHTPKNNAGYGNYAVCR